MDDSTPHETRADAFPVTRKGYDRRQVDEYRKATEARIDALEQHITSLESSMSELGLARPADLAAELDVVGEEVKRILQEARVASEQMRSRAADDAARWRAEADEESRALRESSRSVAHEIRRNVWETGSEMLTSAVDTSEMAVTAATERALFTQAEAEREASRLVGDAKRDRDESVGGARDDAERLVATARQEAESIMSTARRQADAAQERARALESRRTELMAELETARATIAGNDVAPEPNVANGRPTVESTETVTVVEATEDVRTHWPEDEGSVKIVSAARVMSTEPVDADAMVAEIEAMRMEPSPRSPVTSPQPEFESEILSSPSGGGVAEGDGVGQEPEPDPAAEAPSSSSPSGGGVAAGDGGGQDPKPDPAAEAPSSSSPSGGGVAEGDGGGQEPGPDRGPEIESSSVPSAEGSGSPRSEPESEPEPDPLAGLFARLKDPSADVASAPEPAESSSPGGGVGADVEPSAVSDGSDSDLESPSSLLGEGVAEGDGGGQTVPSEDAATEESEPEPSLDPFALRERHLLRVQNRALRSVKRSLVEAQNRALEDLRLIDGWEPDEGLLTGEIPGALSVLARESMVAGFAAAAEMMDTAETPQPDNVDPGDPSSEFTGALIEAAQGSVTRSRGAGAGHREVASALSRVFRSWRTDEAERRVQFASRAAYHIGVTAALADLGATEFEVIPSGRPCRECPANKGSWAITDGLPSGTVMPPSRIECACVIVSSR